jgi:hypothetical protein
MPKDRTSLNPIPQRFFGPVNADTAERLVEMVLDDNDFRHDLQKFATGEIDMREFSYRMQMHMEAHEQRMQEPEGIYGDSGVA